MEELINILLWVGMAAGATLIILLLLSIFSGLDIGGDVDADSPDVDGGTDMPLGVFKTLLTFISVSAFTARSIFLNTSWSWAGVTISAIVAGIVAVVILSFFFRWLLRNQESGNWHMWQAEGKMAVVYVPIPSNGKGRIKLKIDNTNRELVAKSQDGESLATHEKVMVVKAEEDHVVVVPLDE